MFAKNSNHYIVPPLIISFILFYLGYNDRSQSYLGFASFIVILLAMVFFIFSLYLAWFFRDPNREIVLDDTLIYSAADGKVLTIVEDKGELKIAIRMSPFNVHLNRAPVSAKLTAITHKPGKHGSVYFADAEKKNEQNLIIMDNDELIIEILQITGAFARRIECWVNQDSMITQGDKIGMIRFGSQTNVVIKLKNTDKSLKPLVYIGDRVKAGITALARFA